MIALSSVLSLVTIGAGVPAGARTPHQLIDLYPGTPASAMVGTSGRIELRTDPPVPSALSFPDLMWGRAWMRELMKPWLWPPMRSIMAGPPPLNWAMMISMPAMILKSSTPMCREPPTPELTNISLPGFFFARAMSSFTELAWTPGWTTRTFGPLPTLAIGVKDLIGSKVILSCRGA